MYPLPIEYKPELTREHELRVLEEQASLEQKMLQAQEHAKRLEELERTHGLVYDSSDNIVINLSRGPRYMIARTGRT